MQHGTGREYVADILANVEAVLRTQRRTAGWPVGDLVNRLKDAFEAITDDDFSLDEPGVYGPDYAQGLGVSAVSETTVGHIIDQAEFDDAWDDYAGWVARGRPEGGYGA